MGPGKDGALHGAEQQMHWPAKEIASLISAVPSPSPCRLAVCSLCAPEALSEAGNECGNYGDWRPGAPGCAGVSSSVSASLASPCSI